MPHILIVDDEEEILGLFKAWIERLSPWVTVSTVTTGPQALQLYQASGANLIITNYHLPVMSGSELVRTLRARDVTIPIVMISEYPEAPEKSYEAGATLFVPTTKVVKELPELLARFLHPTMTDSQPDKPYQNPRTQKENEHRLFPGQM